VAMHIASAESGVMRERSNCAPHPDAAGSNAPLFAIAAARRWAWTLGSKSGP
jgi:hypothetical protein